MYHAKISTTVAMLQIKESSTKATLEVIGRSHWKSLEVTGRNSTLLLGWKMCGNVIENLIKQVVVSVALSPHPFTQERFQH